MRQAHCDIQFTEKCCKCPVANVLEVVYSGFFCFKKQTLHRKCFVSSSWITLPMVTEQPDVDSVYIRNSLLPEHELA